MERAAEAAGISRATAYRYFPNQRSLLVATHPEIEVTSFSARTRPRTPRSASTWCCGEFLRLTLDSEPELRAMLRLSLEPRLADRDAVPLRRGRAIAWIEEALEPLRGRLSQGEALIWLTDVGGLARDEAAETMRASARALPRDAMARAV